MEPKRVIHIRIRDLRRERELTQEELAEALGISRQSINAMEAGRCLPSLPVAIEIASFFAVPLNQLIALQQAEQAVRQQLLQAGELEGLFEPLLAPAEVTGPAANVSESAGQVVVDFQLPGFQKDDLEIEVGHNFLTVSGIFASDILKS